MPSPLRLHLHYLAHSEVGLVRKNNQDSGYASPTMLVIADGMGGAAAGDLASALAIDELRKADGAYSGDEMLQVMGDAITRANDRIADLVEADHDLDGMGTTVCGALFDGSRLALTHLGDSRGYLLRDGALRRLTHDHSWVQSLIDEGKISEAEAAFHPHRSLLLRVLNGQPGNTPDLELLEVAEGDRVMFCSDGLCGLVDDDELEAILASHPSLDDCLDLLIDAAHAAGGVDNITIALADVTSEEQPGLRPVVLGAAAELVLPTPRPARPQPDDPAEPPAERRGSITGVTAFDDERLENARYSPTSRRRSRPVLKTGLIVGAVLLVVGGLVASVYGYSRTQFYVGSTNNLVAVFRGLPDNVLGVPMHQVFEVTQTQVTDLPPYYQEQVRNTIGVASLDAARQTVAELKTRAATCIAQRLARAQSTTTPTPEPTKKATPRMSVSPAPTSTPTSSPAPEEC